MQELHNVFFFFFQSVYMKDVRSEDMEALLDFMYRGVVHLPQESLTGLLKTAEGLQVGLHFSSIALSVFCHTQGHQIHSYCVLGRFIYSFMFG